MPGGRAAAEVLEWKAATAGEWIGYGRVSLRTIFFYNITVELAAAFSDAFVFKQALCTLMKDFNSISQSIRAWVCCPKV